MRKDWSKADMTNTHIYKILTAADWAIAQTSGTSQTPLDLGDGYVHLSTRSQVGQTLALHYKGVESLRLLAFAMSDLEKMGEVRWEASRGGQLFPHLYGGLLVSAAQKMWMLNMDSDNNPALPEDI